MTLYNSDYDHVFKILIVGDSGVGKTNLLSRYADHQYSNSHSITVGVDFKVNNMEVDNKKIKLCLWDTAGQTRYRSIVSTYFRGVHGIMFVYDITDLESFQNIPLWLKDAKTHASETCVAMLVANKKDLFVQQTVDDDDALQFAEKNNLSYISVSTKTNENVAQAFELLVHRILNQTTLSNITPSIALLPSSTAIDIMVVIKKNYKKT